MTSQPITMVTVPMWGMTMIEAELRTWLVAEGDRVAPGTPLAEIETEKIAGQVEAPCAGVVRRLIAGVGDVLPVGAPLAVMADDDITERDVEAFLSREIGR